MSFDAAYRRDADLRRRVNAFLCETFHLPDRDYFGEMDLGSLLELKSVLSDINNTLTMRLTLGFVDWVAKTFEMDQAALMLLRDDVLNTKPSTNGYDVSFAHVLPLVAEVKCNMPINGGSKYGSAQKNGIIADIEALLNGKLKASTSPDPAVSLKFMVFLDLAEVRAANAHLIASNCQPCRSIVATKNRPARNQPQPVTGINTRTDDWRDPMKLREIVDDLELQRFDVLKDNAKRANRELLDALARLQAATAKQEMLRAQAISSSLYDRTPRINS